MHLKVSQATAVQQFDHRLAVQLKGNTDEKPAEQMECALNNDGTNACAFLSVEIADVILSEVVTGIEFFAELAEAIEDTIWHLPERINVHRDLHRMYDALEAYGILREQKVVTSLYDFSEELPFADTVFSYEGRRKLYSKLCELGCNDFLAVFTCEPLVLTVGCRDGKPYMIDTHPVTLAPGKGEGLLMTGKNNSSDVWLALCIWLWNRLHHQGVKPDACQSLAVVNCSSLFLFKCFESLYFFTCLLVLNIPTPMLPQRGSRILHDLLFFKTTGRVVRTFQDLDCNISSAEIFKIIVKRY